MIGDAVKPCNVLTVSNLISAFEDRFDWHILL